MISTIVAVGGGQAGAQAVDTLRREGFAGRLLSICDEQLADPNLAFEEAAGNAQTGP
jgi:NADPH-dependent 2,4-dienoyl-CoA reductase/sulfur reductase-like enzyme